MVYKRKGFPENGDIVLCTVKKVLFHSVFVYLDEYDNKEGMIHISEVAPGRIRNIRDYVKEGKKIVCKILNVREQQGHIDLSLRRVTESERRTKTNEYKQEQIAEKILDSASHKAGVKISEIYEGYGEKIIKEYGTIYVFLKKASEEGQQILKKIGFNDKFSKALIEIVKEKIRPIKVIINADIKINCYESNGVKVIKDSLSFIEREGIAINYLGSSKFRLGLSSKDYKTGEKKLKEIEETIKNSLKNHEAEFSLERVSK